MNKGQPIIKLENVSFTYEIGKPNEHVALSDINLEIYPGEYVSFLGPSGCGKSTLLYIIAGIDKPTSGRVLINGRDITQMSGKELAIYRQIGIGIIFQNFNLIPSISVQENIMMPMAFLGVDPEVRHKKAQEILDRLNISSLGHRFPFELSGGQQQRVGIARALINEPPLMLADEPLGNLDSENANKVLEFLKELNEKYHKTVIMVTHEAWSLRDVDKVFHMLDGRVTRIEDRVNPQLSTAADLVSETKPAVLSVEDRAETMTHLLLRGYSNQEIARLNSFITSLLKKEITMEQFVEMLDKPFNDGGLGLWKQKARRVGELVRETLKEEENLEHIHTVLKKNLEAPLYDEIREMRNWLLEDIDVKTDSLHYLQLDEMINERVRNIITSDHFIKLLELSRREGGLGFSTRTSLLLNEKLDALMGEELSIHTN